MDQRSQTSAPGPLTAFLELEVKLILCSLMKRHQGGRAISSSDWAILWLFARFPARFGREPAWKRSPPFWEHTGKASTRKSPFPSLPLPRGQLLPVLPRCQAGWFRPVPPRPTHGRSGARFCCRVPRDAQHPGVLRSHCPACLHARPACQGPCGCLQVHLPSLPIPSSVGILLDILLPGVVRAMSLPSLGSHRR